MATIIYEGVVYPLGSEEPAEIDFEIFERHLDGTTFVLVTLDGLELFEIHTISWKEGQYSPAFFKHLGEEIETRLEIPDLIIRYI